MPGEIVTETCCVPACDLSEKEIEQFVDEMADYMEMFKPAFWRAEQLTHSEAYLRGLLGDTARKHAIEYTMSPEKVRVVGQPVTLRYAAPAGDKKALRQKLGWEEDKTIILLIGGGEGMGPLGKTARAIAASGLDVILAIVCGRNQRLKKHLESLDWSVPVHIYGFTRDLPDFMRAADVLVTKAGPGTIAESLKAGLPMILYARLPGQEDGNVSFVVEEEVGVWAPQPNRVVHTLTEWVQKPEIRLQYAENCRRAARPDAARQIARAIGAVLELVPEEVTLV